MSTALYARMLHLHRKTIVNYGIGSAFYILLMFWLYPAVADNSASIDELLQALPPGLSQAFGFESGFGSAQSFIAGEYYGLIFVLLLSVYTVLLSTQLIAKLVDQGAMASLLSAPITRWRLALSQAAVLVTGLVAIVGTTTMAGFAGSAWFLGETAAFDGMRFVAMNAMALLLFFAIGGIAFLISCCSDDEKRALSLSGFIAFALFTLDLLGKLSEGTAWLRSLSLFALYRPGDIAGGAGGDALLAGCVLLLVGIAAFALGIYRFSRRDLPL
ncbi:ABC transporter permease subunit [Paenibacillus aurantiacus]|uniref:ABC transporter permease subunit n=1 Tax=Paenibacillus aurantiacus TaxID=1936118 RepID=A0ABV5KVG8_9BACL